MTITCGTFERRHHVPPEVRITDSDGDLARAAGVLIEFVQGRPIVVDLAHYRELVKGAP